MTSLYHITNDYKEALSELMASDLPDDAISDTLEGLTGEVEKKALAVAAFIANLESEGEQMKIAETRMRERRQKLTNKTKWMRQYLTNCLNSAEIPSVKNSELLVKLNKPRKKVVVDDLELIPESFIKIEKSADKTLLKKALGEGEVEGARLIDGDQTISIK